MPNLALKALVSLLVLLFSTASIAGVVLRVTPGCQAAGCYGYYVSGPTYTTYHCTEGTCDPACPCTVLVVEDG